MDHQSSSHVKTTLTVSKVIATPTDTAWSQAYHAGSVCALFALTQKDADQKLDKNALSGIGKELLTTFQNEYFTIEEKTFETIKKAIQETLTKTPETVTATVIVAITASKRQDILYVFLQGQGKVLLKRNNRLVQLISDTKELTGISGVIEQDDLLVLKTGSFDDVIAHELFTRALQENSVNDIAEDLTPHVHEKHIGNAAGLFITYQVLKPQPQTARQEEQTVPLPPQNKEEEQISNTKTKKRQLPIANTFTKVKERIHFSLPPLSHRNKVLLTIAGIIGVVLTVSIFFTLTKSNTPDTLQAAQEAYASAQKKYDEGQALLSLNKELARDDFQEAEQLLKTAETQAGDDEETNAQIASLLKKVQAALESTSGVITAQATEATEADSPLLAAIIDSARALSATQDEETIYVLSEETVTTIDKDTTDEETIIEGENWSKPVSIGVFSENIYILDTAENTILKYLGGKSKSDYLADDADLEQAVDMAIDGSIWVLFRDGTIQKYTRGRQEAFTLSTLEKPLAKPTKLYTSQESNNLYILDQGAKQIVVVDKKGAFVSQYQSDILATATAFEVNEQERKVYIISSKKLWQIALE